jgi:putative FmdB family regulatory protein
MPLYTYRCDNCVIEFDKLSAIIDKPSIVCPACHKNTSLQQLLSEVSWKGSSGFYNTRFSSSAEHKGEATE